MIKKMVMLCIVLMTGVLQAESENDQVNAIGSQLPNHIRSLLIEEMQAITTSMDVIFRAIIAGEHDQVVPQAQAIHDSFIMAQKMTEADRKILEETLPEAFIKRDQAFHHLSAELAEAARNEDQAKQIKLYQDMQNACIACHQNHALDRFPNLKNVSTGE
ncbi:cytochrome c [Marinicella gelatinilytica]|uniref:cytochrome c n=1 Tax=Marinicella gelatinilytica TaxID=2996017 RepID=UPI002260B179|nr:cytochrome c [Marinicella gelatinilytica]MCX7545692.1 cytochrome c [Marinicella gelatinilytica]